MGDTYIVSNCSLLQKQRRLFGQKSFHINHFVAVGPFSLVDLLIDYAFGASIRIAYGDPDGGDEDVRDGARSAASQAAATPRKQYLSSNPLC